MAVVNFTTPLNAVTETTTSTAIPVEGVDKATLVFTRADHSSGSSAFKVQVSLDDVTYIDYNKLISNVTNTNSQDLTRVGTVTLSSNTSETYTMDLSQDVYQYMKVVVTETTDGTHTAQLALRTA